jgi:hypothetical protein
MLITPYSPRSQSARLLRDALRAAGARADIRSPERYGDRANRPIVNWGNSRAGYGRGGITNDPRAVGIAACKLATFRTLAETCADILPEWTTDPEFARANWGPERTISRTLTRGRSGAGIVPGIVPAPLYVRTYRKRAEYRAHVIHGGIVLIQRKRRKNATAPGGLVWNSAGGYVYSIRHDAPEYIGESARAAIIGLNLQFGAVDILEYRDRAIVLEVNTAPGLTPSTAQKYAQALLTGPGR